MTDSVTSLEPEEAPAPAVRTTKGTFVKGASGNPAGRKPSTKNAITTLRLDTEAALRDFLRPRAKSILRKAISIAMTDNHPQQGKMLTVLLDKTLSSLKNEDSGDTKDTNVTVTINDMSSAAMRRRAEPVTEGEFSPVLALPAPSVRITPSPTKTKAPVETKET